ncbi:MAG: hypothetical protein A2284_13625 [Deltaproteobacteria bacterium RIFOXYA12_FULL_61_11]|nr:MAG: hypothetical protein A2284_13625 [Deltaproteobacteria bacterium RIFOXYA12_FULL_61_11]
MITSHPESISLHRALVLVLAAGSYWGFSEVVLADLARSSGLPYAVDLVRGLTYLLLGLVAAQRLRPWFFLIMAVLAIGTKLLVVPILGLTLACKLNAQAALLLSGLAVTGLAAFSGGKSPRTGFSLVAASIVAGVLASVAFYAVGLKLVPCAYLSSYAGAAGFLRYLSTETVPVALSLGCGFPIGHLFGRSYRPTVTLRPALAEGFALILSAACWLACGYHFSLDLVR